MLRDQKTVGVSVSNILSAHSSKVGFLPEPGAHISSARLEASKPSGSVSIPYALELELEDNAECLACYTGAEL